MQTFIKKNIKYLLLFVFFFLCLHFFYCSFQGDLIYNYGFSYAISRGEIPYKDFNMIIPPIGAFLYAIPLILFGDSLIVLNLFQAFLLCVLFKILFKLLDKKAFLFLPIIAMCYPIPFVTSMFAGYNFLLLVELFVLLYLEKYRKSDYLIGFIIGLSILTKQTVGLCFLLPSLYYFFKKRRKFYKRLLGVICPCLVFLIYLVISGSLYQFIDMCFLGMFDFASSNGTIMDYNFIIFLIELILIIYFIYKDRENINNYYVLSFLIISVPLFDYYHVSLSLLGFLFLLIDKIKIEYSSSILGLNSFLLAFSLPLIWFMFLYDFHMPHLTNFNHFELMSMNKKVEKETKNINSFIEKNKDKNIIILGANAYFFKITNNLDINHYDLLNYGNHGYNGTNKLINMIKKEKKPIFIINIKEYEDHSSIRQQVNKVVMKYVIDNYDKVKVIGEYNIYSNDY